MYGARDAHGTLVILGQWMHKSRYAQTLTPFRTVDAMENNLRPGSGVQGGANNKEVGAEGRLGHAAKRTPHAIVATNLGSDPRGSEWQGE